MVSVTVQIDATDILYTGDSAAFEFELPNLAESLNHASSIIFSWPLNYPVLSALLGAVLLLILAALGKRSIKALRRDWRRKSVVQTTLDTLPEAVALFNPKGQLTAINRKLCELMPVSYTHLTLPTTPYV